MCDRMLSFVDETLLQMKE